MFIVLILNFFLMHLAPGDIADTIAIDAGGADEEMMDAIRKDYGLDLPVWQQLLKYLSKVAVLDLGYSFYYNISVTDLILERLPATLLLVISAQLLAITIGVVLGVIAAPIRRELPAILSLYLLWWAILHLFSGQESC